ncbi:helix-turn-helix transcriptional regulator [Streptomyces sp. 6N106]|uniref:helix-turn-helix transcriptional regulator n=1 Tax=Streptomyces sp. 6N106 TaxID=3457418 RepID=UPI003FD02C36
MSSFASGGVSGPYEPVASADVLERAEKLIRLLRDLVRCDAVVLTAANPFALGPHDESLAADGYSEEVLGRFREDFIPETENPGFRLVRNRVREPLRWSDLARDWDVRFVATSIAEQYLVPAGFREGLSASLWLPDGSHVGAIHMNWETARAATDDRRDIVDKFSPLLAEVSNVLQPHRVLADELHGDAHVALIGNGVEQRIPGRDIGPVLRSDGRLWPLLTALPHQDGGYLWTDDAGTFHRIDLIRCAGTTVLVAERQVPAPYDLTARELQVLTLLAVGASNPKIADVLVVSRRTVSTHVEHILAKLCVASRAEAAALATREGIRLIQPGLVSRSDVPGGRRADRNGFPIPRR